MPVRRRTILTTGLALLMSVLIATPSAAEAKDSTRLPAPNGLIVAAADTSDGSVELRWDEVTGAVEYAIWRDGDWYGWVSAPITAYTDVDPSPGAGYQLRALAADGSWSKWTNSVSAGGQPGPPPVPVGLSAAETAGGSVELQWDETPDAVEYAIWRNGHWYDWVGAPATSYTDVDPSSSAHYQLRALGADGSWSGWTDPVQAEADEEPPPDNVLACGSEITRPGVYEVVTDLICDGPFVSANVLGNNENTPIELRLNGFTVSGPESDTAISVLSDGNSVAITGGGGTITGYGTVTDNAWPPHDLRVEDLTANGTINGFDIELVNVDIDMRGADACGVSSYWATVVLAESSVTGSTGLGGVCAPGVALIASSLVGNRVGALIEPGDFAGLVYSEDSVVADNELFGLLVSSDNVTLHRTTITGNGASGLALEVGTWADLNCGSCNGDFNDTVVFITDSTISGNGFSAESFGTFQQAMGDDGITLVNPWEPGMIGLVGVERRPGTLLVDLLNVSLTGNADAGIEITGEPVDASSSGVTATSNGGAQQCVGIPCEP